MANDLTFCDCKYRITIPSENITSGTLGIIKRTTELVKLDKIAWYSEFVIVRMR